MPERSAIEQLRRRPIETTIYGALEPLAARIGAWLQTIGIASGDRVAIRGQRRALDRGLPGRVVIGAAAVPPTVYKAPQVSTVLQTRRACLHDAAVFETRARACTAAGAAAAGRCAHRVAERRRGRHRHVARVRCRSTAPPSRPSTIARPRSCSTLPARRPTRRASSRTAISTRNARRPLRRHGTERTRWRAAALSCARANGEPAAATGRRCARGFSDTVSSTSLVAVLLGSRASPSLCACRSSSI